MTIILSVSKNAPPTPELKSFIAAHKVLYLTNYPLECDYTF